MFLSLGIGIASSEANASYFFRYGLDGVSYSGNSSSVSGSAPTWSGSFNPPKFISGSPYTYTLPAYSDPDGDSVSLSSVSLPSGFSLSGNQISGTSNSLTDISVSVKLSDGNGNETPGNFTTSRNMPAVFASTPSPTKYVAGQAYSYQLPTFSDPEGTSVALSSVSMPSGFALNSGTRTISGNPTSGLTGNLSATVALTDGDRVVNNYTLTIEEDNSGVSNNPARLVQAFFDHEYIENEYLNTYFPVIDDDGDTLVYSIDIASDINNYRDFFDIYEHKK